MASIDVLLDEGVGVFYEVKAQVAELAAAVAGNEAAIRALQVTAHEMLRARTADREILGKILEACTREGGGELTEAIRHIEACVARIDTTVAGQTDLLTNALRVRLPQTGGIHDETS
jgi:hypothetical protein